MKPRFCFNITTTFLSVLIHWLTFTLFFWHSLLLVKTDTVCKNVFLVKLFCNYPNCSSWSEPNICFIYWKRFISLGSIFFCFSLHYVVAYLSTISSVHFFWNRKSRFYLFLILSIDLLATLRCNPPDSLAISSVLIMFSWIDSLFNRLFGHIFTQIAKYVLIFSSY